MKFHPSLVKSAFISPMGPMTLAATDAGLAGVWFDGQRHHPDLTDCPVNDQHPVLVKAKQQLTDYFAGRRTDFDVALDINGGTLFQQSVCTRCLKFPRVRPRVTAISAGRLATRRRFVLWGLRWAATR